MSSEKTAFLDSGISHEAQTFPPPLYSATIYGIIGKPVPPSIEKCARFHRDENGHIIVEDILSYLQIETTSQEPRYFFLEAMPQDVNMIRTSVWKMLDKITGNFVGAKTSFHPSLIEEAKILSVVRHPNIVEMVDFAVTGNDGKDPNIVMEWLPGGTLGKWIHEGNHTIEEVASIFNQVSNAVSHVNKKGYIYADAKPANIMFDGENNVKLIDFENSQEMDSGTSASVASCFCTHDFAPPEQIHLMDRLYLQTDVYSLAAVLFTMLTNPSPIVKFDRTTFVNNKDMPIPLRSEYESSISPENIERLTVILRKALAEDYQERYANVELLNRKVQKVLHPTGATPNS